MKLASNPNALKEGSWHAVSEDFREGNGELSSLAREVGDVRSNELEVLVKN
jgi:hypothetical protein